MSKTFKSNLCKGSEEILVQIKAQASTPASDFSSTISSTKNTSKGKKVKGNTYGTKSFHKKRPT